MDDKKKTPSQSDNDMKKLIDFSKIASQLTSGELYFEELILKVMAHIINEFPFVAMVIDEDHNILLANNYLLDMLHKNNETIAGSYCPKLIHNTEKPFPGCPLAEAKEKNCFVETELLDPFYKNWINSSIFPLNIKMQNGKKIFLHTAQYISKRKNAEQTVQQQKENLENILESLAQPFYIIDANDYTVKIANSAANFGHLTKDSKCYQLTHQRNTPCDTRLHPCPIKTIKKTKKPLVVELIKSRKDGKKRIFEVHGYPIFAKDGTVSNIIEYTFDITKKKKAEIALFESEERFRTIVETVPSLLIITDVEGHNLYISPNCFEITGYTQEEMRNNFLWWTEGNNSSTAREIFEKYFFRNTIFVKDYEYKLHKKNGEIWYASSSWVPIKGNEGDIKGFVVQTLNITKRKNAEKQLMKINKELEIKSINLEEKNIVLKTLLKFQDEEKNNSEANILANIKILVSPYIIKLKSTLLEENQKTLLNIIEGNLAEVVKPFSNQLMDGIINLTFSELQVANLIVEGKTSKEISEILYISEHTVKAHNRKIRLKLGIKNKKVNLRSYLNSFLKNKPHKPSALNFIP